MQPSKGPLEIVFGVPPLSRVDEERRVFAVGEGSVVHRCVVEQYLQEALETSPEIGLTIPLTPTQAADIDKQHEVAVRFTVLPRILIIPPRK